MADGSSAPYGLVGDIGGTNARFALVAAGAGRPQLIAPRSYLCRDFESAEAAVAAYLSEGAPDLQPSAAVLAVAGPIIDGAIALTNTDWRISEKGFSAALNLSATRLLNDYAALALASPLLGPEDTSLLGPDLPGRTAGAVAILGAGTGFGVSALVRDGEREVVVTTEGGHISFAPTDELEVEIWRILNGQFGRVSIERILSGPGLLNLYRAVARIQGAEPTATAPGEVTRHAETGDPLAMLVVDRFCAILGAVAGDFALAYGAQGGVCLAGGVCRHLLGALIKSEFRKRFEQKGRFEGFLREIPTRVILHTHTVALLGAARALRRTVPS